MRKKRVQKRKKKSNGGGSTGIILLVIGACALGFGLSLRPWQNFFEQREAARNLGKEVTRVEKSRANLLEQETKMNSSVWKEEAARKKGFILPDEKTIN